MQNFYESTKSLDERAITRYALSHTILVENAANGLLELIKQKAYHKSVVTIICGSGDNGADGYALARKLSGSFVVRIYQAKEPKSELCKEMCEKARLIEGIKFINKILPCDVVVDCLFGSGLQGKINDELLETIRIANLAAPLKIACDIPSGLSAQIPNTNEDKDSHTPALFDEDLTTQNNFQMSFPSGFLKPTTLCVWVRLKACYLVIRLKIMWEKLSLQIWESRGKIMKSLRHSSCLKKVICVCQRVRFKTLIKGTLGIYVFLVEIKRERAF